MINAVAQAYKSVDTKTSNGEVTRIDEGMVIKFSVDSGEVKEGKLEAIKSKKKAFSFTITPNKESHKEIWKSDQMLPDTLEIIEPRPVVESEEE